jgi:hypothetical protein
MKAPKPPEWTVAENNGNTAILEKGKPIASESKIITRPKGMTVRQFSDALRPGSTADPATLHCIENPS